MLEMTAMSVPCFQHVCQLQVSGCINSQLANVASKQTEAGCVIQKEILSWCCRGEPIACTVAYARAGCNITQVLHFITAPLATVTGRMNDNTLKPDLAFCCAAVVDPANCTMHMDYI